MNREIKFRAFNIIKREMILPEMLFINIESDGGSCSLFTTISNLSKEYILMQYTGLKDRKGVKIYEGDVVKYIHEFDIREVEKVGSIGFHNSAFTINYKIEDSDLLHMEYPYCEVIGNIHQNPELCSINPTNP